MSASITPAQSIVGYRPGGRPKDDFYPTPDYAVTALLEKEPLIGGVWEPACGTGNISKVLTAAGLSVVSTDLQDYGFGIPGVDFLEAKRLLARDIVTNPPYKLAEDRLWVVLHEEWIDERTLRLFAVWNARKALSLVANPDPRSVTVCDVAERFANGVATSDELAAAVVAAVVAAEAIDAAMDADWVAAKARIAAMDAAKARIAAMDAIMDSDMVAARFAARSAAWDATRIAPRAEVAARSASRSAAWAAARDAAWSMARTASRFAAWVAARSAAWDAQIAHLIEMLEAD